MNIGKYIRLYSEDLQLKNYTKSSISNYCSQVNLYIFLKVGIHFSLAQQ